LHPDLSGLIGIPFVQNGRDPAKGLDCWGLCREVFRRYGIDVPDFQMACYDAFQIHDAVESERPFWIRLDEPEDGCLVLFALDAFAPDIIQHLGVYVGEGKILHTLEKRGSSLIRLNDRFFGKKMRGFYRWNGSH
jgi:cell wall-associated NlpC family hydrolase